MFGIERIDDHRVALSGRLDASQVKTAEATFDTITGDCVVDCTDLAYISSAGIGVIIATYKRLHDGGGKLSMTNLNTHVKQVFHYAGLSAILDIT